MSQTGRLHFEFRLRPLADVMAWGEPPNQSLGWFGLTDGWFWIQAGDAELFRYSDTVLRHWKLARALPYENYQVERFWGDMLQMLPAILDPVPDDIAARVANASEWKVWQAKAEAWIRKSEEESDWDRYHAALAWWSDRSWDAAHLAHPPGLWVWAQNDTVHVRWDNQARKVEGISVWAAEAGEITLPVSEFADAVRSFDTRFLAAMEGRVQEVQRAWPRPEVAVDVPALVRVQATQSKYPLKMIPVSHYEWDTVREALRYLDAVL